MTLNQRLDWLIDQWCERRALRPLQFLLRAYPAALVHTDQFGDLLAVLRDVKKLCQSDLTPDELGHVNSSIDELEDAMNRRLRS